MGFTITWTPIPVAEEVFQAWYRKTAPLMQVTPLYLEDLDGKPCATIRDIGGTGCTFLVMPQLRGDSFCQTDGRPYTVDIMTACIMMREFGMATDLGNGDGVDHLWSEQVKAVHAKCPLATFEDQIYDFAYSRTFDQEFALEALQATKRT
jgi:hypothetical protein